MEKGTLRTFMLEIHSCLNRNRDEIEMKDLKLPNGFSGGAHSSHISATDWCRVLSSEMLSAGTSARARQDTAATQPFAGRVMEP